MTLFDVLCFLAFFAALCITLEMTFSHYEYYYKPRTYHFKQPYFMAHEKEINDLVKKKVEGELNSGEFIAPPPTTTDKKAGNQ